MNSEDRLRAKFLIGALEKMAADGTPPEDVDILADWITAQTKRAVAPYRSPAQTQEEIARHIQTSPADASPVPLGQYVPFLGATARNMGSFVPQDQIAEYGPRGRAESHQQTAPPSEAHELMNYLKANPGAVGAGLGAVGGGATTPANPILGAFTGAVGAGLGGQAGREIAQAASTLLPGLAANPVGGAVLGALPMPLMMAGFLGARALTDKLFGGKEVDPMEARRQQLYKSLTATGG